MALESVTVCPLCGSNAISEYLHVKDHTTSGEIFKIDRCSQCSFTFTNPRPDQKTIGKYYQSENYISHTGSNKKFLDRIYLIARRYTLRWKLRLIEPYTGAGHLLDYGCGTGEFLYQSMKSGWKIQGVEPSELAREKASDLLNSKVTNSIEDIKDSKFDVITLWHVLEHIDNFEQALLKLKNLLTASGTILIAVPNHESPDAQEYKANWAGYDVPRHFSHFTKRTMELLLGNLGLHVIDIIPMKLDAYYVSLLSEKYKLPFQNKFLAALKAIKTGALSNWQARDMNNHSSLIYIAKKR
jgi:2-polyprenyl-3-methyl-5-hydroxy-6-metoxy-1,4-benzoquinol methylase